jgi:hypothetical protein
MLRILGNPKQVCAGVTRREVLMAGGCGALGMALGNALARPAHATATEGPERKAKSVIFMFLFGGWSQLETFDMKPDAAAEVRGPYKPIASSVPGTFVCEHLPLLARRMDKVAVVRSVHSDDANHNTSLILSGHHATIGGTALKGINPGIPTDWPFFMSALEHFWEQPTFGQHRESVRADTTLPPHMCVPNRLGLLEGYHRTGPYGGFLGAKYDPVCTQFGKTGEYLFQKNGVSAESFSVTPAGAALGPEMTLDHLKGRASLLQQLDEQRRELRRSRSVARYAASQQRALDLLTSDKFRRVLDLRSEPPALRERYGWNLFGQSVLLSRRLVEAGVPLVTSIWDCTKEDNDISLLSWDTHWDHFKACEGWLLPGTDHAVSTLLDDLAARGLLDETLVVCLSEMGRTPKINGRAGRDHWVGTYCALFAGAGIKTGVLHGRSDKIAGEVADSPVSPQDLLATVYHLCGIGPEAMIYDHLRRPVPLYGEGKPIGAILV